MSEPRPHPGRGRRRDRRVYLASHPVLFALLSAGRRVPVRRIGRTVLVHHATPFADALRRVPLDRSAERTTAGAARRATGGGEFLFDQDGSGHRRTRRDTATVFGSDGVARLRPVWLDVLRRRLAPLGDGAEIDIVDVVAELAGAATLALLDVDVAAGTAATPGHALTAAARAAAATAARHHLPGLRWPGRARRDQRATARAAAELARLLGAAPQEAARTSMLAVASINTTMAAIPRAVAWCADDRWWAAATDAGSRDALVAELLRVTAASPVLPRVAAGAAELAGVPVRAGDRLLLVARNAVRAGRPAPDPGTPVPAAVGQLVFGTGPHRCPGARLAHAQLADVLAVLAPYRPVVTGARVDRRSALPGWARLTVRATTRSRR
ncbi:MULTISPECIES: cytochrome P450 [unclassified Solwaraspora]|uniref:cytochrome P450 n=1 Tax=unclassified Solwaraspora TaxID=2627926 RepID=UPI00259B4044|nr:cytochrome P450 [Solwaraspora sp. WMMA2056]WJK39443.1 cytochrome P450 [Solwaraspora sp. WMMA2056]